MKNWIDKLDVAFKRTKSLIWPFKMGVWLRLALLLALSGGCSNYFPGGGGGGGSSNQSTTQNEASDGKSLEESDQALEEKVTELAVEDPTREKPQGEKSTEEQFNQAWEKFQGMWKTWNSKLGFLVWGIVLFGFTLFWGFLILMTWVTSRIQIMLIRVLATKAVSLKENWRACKELGNSLFRLNVVLYILPLIIFSGVWALRFMLLELDVKAIFSPWAIGITAVLIILWVLVIMFFVMITTQVLPICSYAKNEYAWDSMKRIGRYIWGNKLRTLGYMVFYFVFSMAVSAVAGIAVFILVMVTLIPAAPIGYVGWKIFAEATMLTKIVVGGLFGSAYGLVILAIVIAAMVPIHSFLAYLRMELIGIEMKEVKSPIT